MAAESIIQPPVLEKVGCGTTPRLAVICVAAWSPRTDRNDIESVGLSGRRRSALRGFVCLLVLKSSCGWVKVKLKAPTLSRIRYVPCFDLTHAPVAAAARAAATGPVSMSTRPNPEGSGTVEIATQRCEGLGVVPDQQVVAYYQGPFKKKHVP